LLSFFGRHFWKTSRASAKARQIGYVEAGKFVKSEIVMRETPPTRATKNRSRDLGSTIMIVGGGIGGLTAALALQHFGIAVRVFEQTAELREIGAGVTVTPNAMPTLDFLGVGNRIADEAGPVPQYQVCKYSTGEVLEYGPDPATIEETFGAGYYNLHRADLQSALLDAINSNDPSCIALDHRFEHLEQSGARVTARFANGNSYTGAALVGCDGGASRVRSVVFGSKEVSYTGQAAFRALVPMPDVPKEVFANPYRVYVGRGQTLIHYPLRHNSLLNLIGVALQPDWQAEGWAISATVEEFSSLFRDFLPHARDLIRCVPPDHLFKWGLRDREPMQTWTRDRVTMLGDAAHPFLPFLGQGACIAIEDGLLLGRAVAAAGDIAEAFERYEAARKTRANEIQLATLEQGRQHQGTTEVGPNPGNTAASRGLYNYNPAVVPV
jgi:salicylate hydroxylase